MAVPTIRGMPGVFEMCDTFGLPLEIAVDYLHEHGLVVAWDEFIKDARQHGWTEKTIRKKILGAVQESIIYDHEYKRIFETRLDAYMEAPAKSETN